MQLARQRVSAARFVEDKEHTRQLPQKRYRRFFSLDQLLFSPLSAPFFLLRLGEAALEVGLSVVPVSNGWTAQPQGGEAKPVHMLPVFRLPVVSKAPPSGFIRRIPREETQRERECRIKEEEEVDKMKTTLGLTDRELAALEEELLSKNKRHQAGNGSVASPTLGSPIGHDYDEVQLGRDSYELLSEAGPLSKHTKSDYSASGMEPMANTKLIGGKGRRQPTGSTGNSHAMSRNRTRTRDRCGRGGESDLRYARDKNGRQETHDSVQLVDRPTPRILRRGLNSTLRAEGGTWAPAGGLGNTSGTILGTTATTEQIVAAAADAGMVNILELRRELGRSVWQVRVLRFESITRLQGIVLCGITKIEPASSVLFTLSRWFRGRMIRDIDPA